MKTRPTVTYYINMDLANWGTVEIQRETLRLTGNGGGFGTGAWKLAAGAILQLEAGYTFQPGATFDGPGRVRIVGGIVNMDSSNLRFGAIDLIGGVLGGNSTVIVTNLTWTDGSMTGGGVTTIPSSGNLEIAGASTKFLGARQLYNYGSGTWSGGSLSVGAGTRSGIFNLGTFTVLDDLLYDRNGAFFCRVLQRRAIHQDRRRRHKLV